MPLTYQPAFRVHNVGNFVNFGPPVTSTSVLITGLSPSTQYDFQITAINAFGTTPSTPVSATTPAAASITGIALAPQTFTAGSPIGTTVGTVTVTLSSGSFAGGLTVTGTDAGSFVSPIVGNQLKLAVNNTTAKTYSINIVAAQSGLNSLTVNFPNITGTSAIQESVEGFVVQGTDTTTIMYASTTRGVAQPSPPYDQFTMVATNGNSVNLLQPGQSLINTTSGSVSKIVYGKHTCFQTNTAGGWWYWDTSKPFGPGNWNPFGINSIVLSSSTYPAVTTNGTPIASISVTMLQSTDTFAGTLTVDDTVNFKIVSGVLQSTKALGAGPYTPTITATPYTTTDASAQVLGSVLPVTPTLTLAGSGTVTAPAVATGAGYNTLLWSDDFTSNTVATSSSQGFGGTTKWWWGPSGIFFGGQNCVTFQPTWHAQDIPLGQGAGSNSSSAGGILILNPPSTSPSGGGGNSFIMTVPNNISSIPTSSQGAFNKIYTEIYMAYDPAAYAGSAHNFPTYWFPAWWSWTVEGMYDGRFGLTGSPFNSTSTEIDFMEDQSNTAFGGGSPNPQGFNAVNGYFPGGGGTAIPGMSRNYPASNAQWHTFGFLWDSSNNVSFYKDTNGNGTMVRVGSPLLMTNVNANFGTQHIFLILGTGFQWPVYVDWVRVWGSP